MATQIDMLKHRIEQGDSCIYAYEQMDLRLMRVEGNDGVAQMIETVLELVENINSAANIE